MINRMTMGKSIEQCRESKGLTRSELAKKSGVCVQSLYYWEGDLVNPRADLLIYVADALGVTLDELVGRTVR